MNFLLNRTGLLVLFYNTILFAVQADPIPLDLDSLSLSPDTLQENILLISRTYSHDLELLAEKLNEFNTRIAKAQGTHGLLQRRRYLRETYGPFWSSSTTDIEGVRTVTDRSAWNFDYKLGSTGAYVRAELDPVRYKDVDLTSARVIVRSREPSNDLGVSQGNKYTYYIPLHIEISENSVKTTEFCIPADLRKDLVIEASIQIEVDLIAVSQMDIP